MALPESDATLQLQHRHYLRNESLISTGINLAVNAAFAVALFHSYASIPLYGPRSVLGDTIATVFMLPFITCMIVTPLTRVRVRAGRVAGYAWVAGQRPFLQYLPANTLSRAILLGTAAAAFLPPILVAVCAALGVTNLGFVPFLVYKCALGATLAALVTPVIALRALGVDAS
jgi:hypothetical protein